MNPRRLVRWLLSALGVGVVGLTLTGMYFHRLDAHHAEFYGTGRTINGFLEGYCTALESSLETQQVAPWLAHYSETYSAPGRGQLDFGSPQVLADVTVLPFRTRGDSNYDRALMKSELERYLSSIRQLDHTACKIDLIEELDTAGAAQVTVKLFFDGLDMAGQAFQDRLFFRWRLADESTDVPHWRIVSDQLVHGVRVQGKRGGLVAVDLPAAGLDFRHRRDPTLHMKEQQDALAFGVIQHASGGISAADVDRDGLSDLFFADGVGSRLYRNLGPDAEGVPRFEDVTEAAGLEGLNRTHVGLFADFDNDGDRDLFAGRYLAGNRYFEQVGPPGTIRFVDRSEELGLDAALPTSSATLLDYDLDGDLDLYVGLYGNAFEAFPRLPFYARNGIANRLYRNDGAAGFLDVTPSADVGDTGWTLAVASGDVDGDGDGDLVVANDFGRKSLYLNQGDGTFDELAKEAGVLDFSGGMGLALGDYDDDGRLDLYTSNINSNQRWFGEDLTVGQYMRNVARTRWAWLDAMEYVSLQRLLGSAWSGLGKQIGEGNSLFRNIPPGVDGKPRFEEIHDSRTRRAGWGWSVAFLDVDNDTDLDLYAANGWISNTPETDL